MARKGHKPVKGTRSNYFKDWDERHKQRANPKQRIEVKLLLTANDSLQDLEIPRHLSLKQRRELFAQHLGDHDAHVEAVRKFARKYQLKVVDINTTHGTITLSGTVDAMNTAFQVDLHQHEVRHHKTGDIHHILGHTGDASVPEEIHDFVRGIVGLNRPPAMHHVPEPPEADQICIAKGLTSAWFARYYRFPERYRGKGQHIAILSCGGGFDPMDFQHYFKKAGFKKIPKIQYVALDGSKNSTGTNRAGDYELYTDCLVAACAAPEAKITVYSVENSIFGFARGIAHLSAMKRPPQVISYSWGASEDNYTEADITAVNRKLQYAAQVSQISIFCASGDFGSTNAIKNTPQSKLTVQYPAGSPWVTSCGGTMFELSARGKIKKEVVWSATYLYNLLVHNASGGGFSRMHKRPKYQKHTIPETYPQWTRSKRGIPDVAAHANVTPNNLCYWVFLGGQPWVTGGTSSAAPLWAALTARLNEALKTRIGFFNPLLYEMAAQGILKSITTGSNKMPDGPDSWEAAPGWDPCTGLGVPDGEAMLAWLQKYFRRTSSSQTKS